MPKLNLVIFDCDGVLVDSERITNSVFAKMLNEIGIPATLESMYEEFVGKSLASCFELIESKLGAPVPETFAEELNARSKTALEESLLPVDGIKEALNKIELPSCVASSGSHQKMRLTLGLCDLFSFFEGRIFSVDDVSRGKPHPDIFLHAAEQMDALPSKCVVIEDSVAGVTAAVAAGMTVLGYAALTKAEKLKAAGAEVFSDMGQLPGILQELQAD